MNTTTERLRARPTRRGALARDWATVRRLLGWPVRVYRARQLMHQLAGLAEHELRDIGLTRQDLHDLAALPSDADPSRVLRARVAERRRWL